jgi:enolase
LADTAIEFVKARVVFNSRGEETIEVNVKLKGGCFGRAAAPSGASVGKHEVPSLPKKGVNEAVKILNENYKRFVGVDASSLKDVAEELKILDGTDNYYRVGGAVAYALSFACAEAAANMLGKPLFELLYDRGEYKIPYPLGNVLGGGKHAGGAAPDIQEFLVCPYGAKNVREAVKTNVLVHKEVGNLILKRDPSFTKGKGDEGAWAPNLSDEEALDIVKSAADKVQSELGVKIGVGLDVASSSFWDGKSYIYKRSNKVLSTEEQIEFLADLVKKYDLIYLEDPLHEDAFEDTAKLVKRVNCLVVGDDLLTTNYERLRKAINLNACNGAILKVNQAGTIYDSIKFANLANENKITIITSHRSGDVPDAHIAHLAIATNSKMIKTGVLGGERVAKLNELIRIEENYGLKMVKW